MTGKQCWMDGGPPGCALPAEHGGLHDSVSAVNASDEHGPMHEALQIVKRERDDARLREDSAHALAKRLLGNGPNLMEIIRRAAIRQEEIRSAARALLLTYMRPSDPMWCGCCASKMDEAGHKPDCAAAALVRVLNAAPVSP